VSKLLGLDAIITGAKNLCGKIEGYNMLAVFEVL